MNKTGAPVPQSQPGPGQRGDGEAEGHHPQGAVGKGGVKQGDHRVEGGAKGVVVRSGGQLVHLPAETLSGQDGDALGTYPQGPNLSEN